MMATIASRDIGTHARSIAPDTYERVLSIGAIVLLGFILAAVACGYGQWASVPAVVWPHLLTILVAVALTPVLLLGRRATRRHRTLGTIWVAA